jgi:hypothetical protein
MALTADTAGVTLGTGICPFGVIRIEPWCGLRVLRSTRRSHGGAARTQRLRRSLTFVSERVDWRGSTTRTSEFVGPVRHLGAQLSTADVDEGAGDVLGRVAGQEADQVRHLLGPAPPA